MSIFTNIRLRLFALLSILLILFGVQSSLQIAQAQQISFSASGLDGENTNNPTSLQFGPDGRLYVSQQNGTIYAFNVTRNDTNDYDVTSTETLNQIKDIINHNDDGSSTSQGNRQVTGLVVAGTGANPILYVSSSDPRIGAGGGGNDKGLDTNSGMISRLECVGGITGTPGQLTCSNWVKVDLVRGLPRSEENHATNGMQLDETTNTLYLAVGGHTNAGSPSNNFAFTVEYTYSSTIIAVDLDMMETMDILTDPNDGSLYIYDLPTLDDPTRDNVFADGTPASEDPRDADYSPLDVGDPFGGNDGLNMAKIDLTGPVSIHAIGFRNLYDIVLTEDDRMYGVDNGANGGWGGHPDGEADYDAEYNDSNPQCTNLYLNGEPGSNGSGQGGDDKVNNQNGLHYIRPLQPSDWQYVAQQDYYYGGHPHVILANPGTPNTNNTFPYDPQGAGIYTFSQEDGNGGPDLIDDHSDPNPNDGNNVAIWRNQILDPDDANFTYESLPVDWPPVPVGSSFPAGCDFRNSGQDDHALANFGPSTNGITEYTASNFGGAMQGDLLLAYFGGNGGVYRVQLNNAGDVATNCPTPPQNGTSTVSSCGNATIFSGFGGSPLDVTAQGDDDPFGGTVWAVTYGANNITVFEPADYDGNDPILCEGTDDATIDEDFDLYSNADELDAGTNPCSGASQPFDFDGALEAGPNNTFKLSDFNDLDDDNDGILDVDDAFNFDANNGTGSISQLPLRLEFFNSTGYGFGELGLTGIMTNGVDDYFTLVDDNGNELVFGGTAGIYTDPTVSEGDAYQADNDQQNGFQFGIDVDTNTGPFTVESQINGPFFDGNPTPGNYASQGIYIGTGDQNNYIKFVLAGNIGGFQILQESNGTVVAGASNNQNIAVSNIFDATAIQLYLSIDPTAGTLQASYSIDGGTRINVGVPVTITGDLLNAVQGTYTIGGQASALATGMIATSTGAADEFSANWDYFDVSQNPSETTAIISVDTSGINGSTFGNNSFQIQNTSNNGATITNVVIDLAGAGDVILPEVVFDPDGTAGDATSKDLTFNTDDGGTGYITHSFDNAYEGGFYTLSIDFNDFDPAESVAFGLDIDPVSIKGGVSPGPNASGSVSGLELTGATAIVTFSTGEVWQVDLFRTANNDSDSTAIVRNALPLPVNIEMLGQTDGDITFSPNQTIRVTGEVGEEVRLLHVESGLFVSGLTGPHAGVGYSIDPFEVNSVIGINEYTDFISNSFDVTFDVTLTNTDVNGVDPTGYNTFVAVVVDNDGATSAVSNVITVQYDPTIAPDTIYRVNTSNATIPATDGGLDWVAAGAAGAQSGNGFSVNTGSISTQNVAGRDASLPDYAPQALFTQERYDVPAAPEMEWAFDVTPGTYVVNLFMGNGFGGTSAIGERVFDITIEGQLVADNLDLVATFGHQVAGMQSYIVTVNDNSLDILFGHVTENPLINAIEILYYDDGTGETPITLGSIEDQNNVEGDAIGNQGLFVSASGGDGNLSYTATGLPDGVLLEPTNGQFFGTVNEGAAANSPYTVTVTVDDSDSNTDDAVTTEFEWVITEELILPSDEPLICINIGGVAGTAFGRDFIADNGNGTTSTYVIGGSKYGSTTNDTLVNIVALDGTDITGFEEDLYQTERYGGAFSGGTQATMTIEIGGGNLVLPILPNGSLPSGDYIVDLYFAEIYQNVQPNGTPGGVGSRVFDVILEGTLIRDDFDLFAIPDPDAPLTAIVVTELVSISDGALTVDFEASADNAKVSAVCITPAESEAPVIDTIDDVTSGILGIYETGRFLVTADDAQDDNITFSAEGLPAGLEIDPTSGEIFGTVEVSALTGGTNNDGIHEVTITATDDSPELNSSTETFIFTVVERTITIENLTDGATVSSSGFSVDWTSTGGATDVFEHIHVLLLGPTGNPIYVDDDVTRYGSQPLNGSASFPSDASGPYPTLPEGDYVLELRWAYPSHIELDLTDVPPTSINITISDSANLPPLVTNPGDQTNVEGETVSLPIVASPPEQGQTLSYSAQGLPDGLTVNPTTGVISGVLPTATPGSTGGAFIENNGIVVIEAESADNLPNNWETINTYTSPNVNDPTGATGDDFIVWEAGQNLGTPGIGLITYQVQITNPGTYQFKWRSQVGNGTSSTDHNDTWLKIEADSFFGQQGGSNFVCPKGYDSQTNDCTGDVPDGAGANGWFKVYSSGSTNWTWSTNTSDNDAHQIYATFDAPGVYNILVSARSSSHLIDRMVLVNQSLYGNNGQSTAIPESNRASGDPGDPGSAGTYNVTVTVTDDGSPTGSTDTNFVWVVNEAVGNPSAFVQVTPGSGLTSSTFGNNSFIIENTGDVDITNITINASTAFMPDVVFDPVGTAGDNGAKCLTTGTAGDSASAVGITVPADGGSDTADCESVFADPHNGVDSDEGYDTMSLDFTDFNPTESYAFGVDMDPTTIKGDLSTGDAGSISGFELIGSVVTITFANGESISSTLTDEGSLGGSQALIERNLPSAPSIAVDGVVTPAQVTNANQIVVITGTPGEDVTLLQIDARLHIDAGNPTIGYDIDPFEANEAMAKVIYIGTIPADGTLEMPVTLLASAGSGNTPDGGLNHFIAFYNDDQGDPYGEGSETVVLELTDELLTATINASLTLQGRSDYSGDVAVQIYEVGVATPTYTLTATVDALGNLTIEGIEPGTWEVAIKHPRYLQAVQSLTLVAGDNSATFGELLAGDTNDDNQVSALDFSLLASTFNLSEGDAGYNGLADFNGDGQVSALDFSLLASNFNQSGDAPTGGN